MIPKSLQLIIIDDMITDIPRNEWGKYFDELKPEERDVQGLANLASLLCTISGELSEYLEWRGAAGCGDHGHDEALAKAQKRRKKIRKALGYTYPGR